MKAAPVSLSVLLFILSAAFTLQSEAGTWRDHFHEHLPPEWSGDRQDFVLTNGVLAGQSAFPVGPSPLNILELAIDSSNCVVQSWVNVVLPNLRVCTKAALILRHTGTNGYVFALHQATQTLELYRLSNNEMLFIAPAAIELGRWYHLRAELQGPAIRLFLDGRHVATVTDNLSPSGAVGLAVQDAETAWFDNFSVTGPNIIGNVDEVTRPALTLSPGPAGLINLRFLAEPPYDYLVQASSTPSGHDWQTITNLTAKLEPFEALIHDQPASATRFYRVEKLPCHCR